MARWAVALLWPLLMAFAGCLAPAVRGLLSGLGSPGCGEDPQLRRSHRGKEASAAPGGGAIGRPKNLPGFAHPWFCCGILDRPPIQVEVAVREGRVGALECLLVCWGLPSRRWGSL